MIINEDQNELTDPKDNAEGNDSVDASDDSLGENTEITPLAKEVLGDSNPGATAKENQENKDPQGEEG